MPYKFLTGRDSDVSADNVARYSVIVAGAEATGDPDLVRLFEDNREFRRWAEASSIGKRVDSVFQTLEKEVMPQQRNQEWVEKMQRLGMKRKISDFQAFAKLVGADVRDEKVINLAVVEKTPLTPSIFDPMLLWDRRIEFEPPQGAPQDSRTSTLPVPSGWWPVLGWFGWDNRPRSARVFGLNVLYENNWFGGRTAWLVGFNMLLNLYHLGFDQTASSVISF